MTTNIGPSASLMPRSKYFDEVGENCINVDGVITIMQQTDTPQAKAINHAYRKRLAAMRKAGDETEKMRENALFAAFDDLGIRVTLTPINGSMED